MTIEQRKVFLEHCIKDWTHLSKEKQEKYFYDCGIMDFVERCCTNYLSIEESMTIDQEKIEQLCNILYLCYNFSDKAFVNYCAKSWLTLTIDQQETYFCENGPIDFISAISSKDYCYNKLDTLCLFLVKCTLFIED